MWRGALVLVLALAGCAPAASMPDPVETPPVSYLEVDGRVAYPVPVDRASPEAIALHRSLEAVLAVAPEGPRDRTLDEMQRWAERVFGPFVRDHRARLLALEHEAATFAEAGHADELRFAAIVVGYAWERFHRLIQSSPVPDGVAEDEELAGIYRDALLEASVPTAHRAAVAYGACARVNEAAPSAVVEWSQECASRADALGSLRAPERQPERSAPRPSIEWPSACALGLAYSSPEAPAPDRSRTEEVALRYVGPTLDEIEREHVLRAVADELTRRGALRIVPVAEVGEATRLSQERRLAPGGPQCGREPPVGWLLSRAHPNLLIGSVGATCDPRSHRSGCDLWVGFHRPGSSEADDLPPMLSGALPAAGPRRWERAAASMVEAPRSGSVGVLRGDWRPGPARIRVFDIDDEDPWLRVAPLLAENHERLAACVRARSVGAFRLRFVVSPLGQATVLRVTAENGSPEEAACVERVVRELAWPCTPSASSQQVDVGVCVASGTDE